MEDKSKCRVTRIGKVKGVSGGIATIEVEGKAFQVPLDKVAPLAKAGDFVKWNGNGWAILSSE